MPLRNLHDIFAGNFNFSEFEKYGGEYGDDADAEKEDDYYEDEVDGVRGTQIRQKRKSTKSKKKRSIFEVYEPDTRERGFFTDCDSEIRNADIPERLHWRTLPVRSAAETELKLESGWTSGSVGYTVDKEGDSESGQRIDHELLLLYDDEDDDDARPATATSTAEPVIHPVTEAHEDSDASDADDFIVNDNIEPINVGTHAPEQRKRRKGDAPLRNLHDIFGGNFNFSEFEKYGGEYGDDADAEKEDDYYEDEVDGVRGTQIRQKRKSTKSKKKRSIFEVYEPDTRERGFFTDCDSEIRNADIPERLHWRTLPVRSTAETEVKLESGWTSGSVGYNVDRRTNGREFEYRLHDRAIAVYSSPHPAPLASTATGMSLYRLYNCVICKDIGAHRRNCENCHCISQ